MLNGLWDGESRCGSHPVGVLEQTSKFSAVQLWEIDGKHSRHKELYWFGLEPYI